MNREDWFALLVVGGWLLGLGVALFLSAVVVPNL